MSRRIALLGALAFVALACSSSGTAVTIHTEAPREDPAELDPAELDTDDDGVVSRDALDAAEEGMERDHVHLDSPPLDAADVQAAEEAEAAERRAERAQLEAAAAAVIADDGAVAAQYPGGQINVGRVRESLAASPPSLMEDSQNPTHAEFLSRLSSMLQLRLVAVALDELGFAVDIDGTDEEVSAQAQAHIDGAFEEFAQQRTVAEDPKIGRLATPHCVSALVLTTETDAAAASQRVRSGEALADVAAQVNLAGFSSADGTIGCGQPFELLGAGDIALALLELDVGELAEPIMQPASSSPTGEAWVVIRLDELQSDQTDLASIGPFAGHVLTDVMAGYEIIVAPELGFWDPSNLRVSMPYFP